MAPRPRSHRHVHHLAAALRSTLRGRTWAVARFAGSRTSILRTQSFAPAEILGQGSAEKSSGARSTASKICCSVSPKNGGTPQSRMYRMTPQDLRGGGRVDGH